MAVLKDEMEKGKISADMVRDAMVSATEKGGLFYQGMDKGANTLNGIWSTLMDTAGMTIRKLVGLSETGDIIKNGLVDKVKNAINGLITFLNDNQDKILKWVNDIFGWMKDNFPVIAGIITFALIPAFWGLAAGIWATLAPLLPFMAAGAAIGYVLNEVAKSVGGWGNMMEIAKKTLNDLWNFLSPIFMPVLKELKAVWDDLIKVLTDFWQKNKDWIIPTLQFIGMVIGVIIVGSILYLIAVIKAVLIVVDLLVRAFSWVADQVRQNVNQMVASWDAFKLGIEIIAGAIKNSFRAAFNAVAGFWNDTIGKLSFTVPNWVPAMGGKTWSVPKIPYLAEGTDYFQGGPAIVGEQGPELVNLPTGSSVTPNKALGGVNITVNMDGIMARSRADLREIAKDMIGAVNEELRAKGKAEMAI